MLAITLQRQDFREADQRISFYTKEAGKVEAIARGVKKSLAKNTSALEPFAVIEIEVVPGRELSYVVRAYPVEPFLNIQGDLQKMVLGSFFLKMVDNSIAVGLADERIFRLLRACLKILNSEEKFNPLLVDGFLLGLWSLLGFLPIFDRCAKCGGRELSATFDPREGGMLCQTCEKSLSGGIKTDAECVKILKDLLGNPLQIVENLNEELASKIHHLVTTFVEYRSGKKVPLTELVMAKY